MWKKKKLKKRKKLISRIYFYIFLTASFFTWLFLSNLYAHADLETYKLNWNSSSYESRWPVEYVLYISK